MTRALPPEQIQKADARALFGAAEDGDAPAVARLLAAGVPADSRRAPGGETPLMRAAARGHEEVARVLLDAGADVSAQRGDGFTALILSVFFGHESVVRLLVERGADAHARTSLGTTAARWAASRGFEEMADLLRDAEAARPRAVAPAADAAAVAPAADATAAVSATASAAPDVTSARVATPPPDEVSIFSRKAERRDARGAVARALALKEGGASVLSEDSAQDVSALNVAPRDVPRRDASRSADTSSEFAQSNSAAGVSVRSGGQVPSHPSASAFRLGHFLRSWQGSVGTAMLLLALGVAVFALVRGGPTARDAAPAQVQPTPVAPQAAGPIQPTPAVQPTPAFPTPDPLAVMPVTDPAYAAPGAAGQPFYVPQPAPGPVPADVPRDLTVVSESGASANENSGRATRRPEPGANDASSARPDARTDAGTDAAARPAARPTRTPEPEPQRPAPPPSQSSQPPAPQPTPGRAKVIPWPPQ